MGAFPPFPPMCSASSRRISNRYAAEKKNARPFFAKVGRSFVILPAFAYEEYAKLVISQLYSVENETKEKITT